MARTQIGTTLIANGSVRREDMDTTTSGNALTTKVLVNSPLTISSTGVDPGTGDVTLGLSTANLVTSFNTRVGAVTLSGSDVTTALGFTPISGYTETDTLATVTGRGATTTNAITVGGLTVATNLLYTDTVNGRVGIGTNSPSYKLQVNGSVYFNGTTNNFYVDGVSSFGGTNSYSTVINNAGSVGIGTTSPAQKLDVIGKGVFGTFTGSRGSYSNGLSVQNTGGEATSLFIWQAAVGSGHLGFKTNDSTLYLVNSYNTGLITEANYLALTTTGNVGIGTTPSYKLTVAGSDNSIIASFDHTLFVGRQVAFPGRFMIGPLSNGYPEIGYNFTTANSVYTKVSNDTAWGMTFGVSNRMSFRYAAAGTGTFSWTEYMSIATSGNVVINSGNLLINTSTDTGYRLNVNGTAYITGTTYIGGVATLNSDANIAGNVSTPQITARRYYQNPDGVPTNNLGTPTVTEMALFDEQFDNKTAFYPFIYGSSILTFETYDGTTWTDISSTLTDTQKKQLFGGDNTSSIVIPYGTVQYRITINNPGPYVFANALYCYWSGNGHSTQVHIWKKHNSGSWTQHTSSTTQVSSWPGHLYLPFAEIPWHPSGTLGVHYHQIRVVFIPTWNATFPTNNINLYKTQWWGGYPAGKRVVYSTDENRNVVFPTNLSANGAITASGTISASGGNSSNWNTAYGWGNHASAGYLTSVTNVSGYSGTLTAEDNRTISPSELIANRLKFGFTSWNNNNTSPYADFLHLRSYADASGGLDNLIMFRKDTIGMRIWQQTYGSATAYATYVDVWHSGNLTNLNQLTNGPGYITSYTETDTLNSVTGRGATTTNAITVGGLTVATNLIYTDTVNNRVGIGTSIPGSKLEIDGNNYQTGLRISDTTSHSTNLFQYGTVFNINSQFVGDSISIQPADYFKISTYSSGIVERLRVVNNGNVLIGTTTDSGYKLDVQGTLRSTGNAYFDSSVGIGTTQPVGLLNLFGGTGNNPAILTLQSQSGGGGNTGIYFRPYQNVTFANTAPAQATILAIDASYSAHITFSTKVPGSGTNSLVERMRLGSLGNLMIGTTSDSGDKLQVNGDIRSTGIIKSMYQAGDEGGELVLNVPATNTSLSTSVTIDVYQNKLRIFETGGSARGGYFDLSSLAPSAGTNFVPTGYTGTFTVPSNPPGMQNLDIQNGIIVNVF